ncbi:MAG: class I SAM-dependent methyltransferase, partial [Verrucomicrobia bacterium]|nr:class I SAM-dependent methyltransferase [Verrucomicrobiota bacterium]
PEKRALERLSRTLKSAPDTLDLGVGAGRTVPMLLSLSRSYVAIDYSEQMISICRHNYPNLAVRQGDARKLSDIANNSFDLVVFSFNGLDAMGHQDRLISLREINRVLRVGGAFLFSSHNREIIVKGPWFRPDLRVDSLKDWGRYAVSIVRHIRLRDKAYEAQDHAIRNDRAHDFSILHYYIEAAAQVRQLAAFGFGQPAIYRVDGSLLLEGESANGDDWLYYLCWKNHELQ